MQNDEHKMALISLQNNTYNFNMWQIFSKWENNVGRNCNLCNKEDDISHMLFTGITVRIVCIFVLKSLMPMWCWEDVSLCGADSFKSPKCELQILTFWGHNSNCDCRF